MTISANKRKKKCLIACRQDKIDAGGCDCVNKMIIDQNSMIDQNSEDFICKFILNDELIKFATEFSEKYRELDLGEYFSDNKKYHIKYFPTIKDTFTGVIPVRVSNVTGIIEIDKSFFDAGCYTSDFVFYIIIWCVACFKQPERGNIKMADKISVEYYITTKRSRKNLKIGLINFFDKCDNKVTNKERFEEISVMLLAD
jgi:hypothetical protein